MSCPTNSNACAEPRMLEPVFQGDSKSIQLTFKDENDAVIDLTGDTLTLTIKAKKSDVTPLHEEVQPSGSMVDPVNGATEFLITGAVTETFPAGKDVLYDIYWERSNGTAVTFVYGSFKVIEPVHD